MLGRYTNTPSRRPDSNLGRSVWSRSFWPLNYSPMRIARSQATKKPPVRRLADGMRIENYPPPPAQAEPRADASVIGNSRHRSNMAIRCKLCADMTILALAKLSLCDGRILPEFGMSVKSYLPDNRPL